MKDDDKSLLYVVMISLAILGCVALYLLGSLAQYHYYVHERNSLELQERKLRIDEMYGRCRATETKITGGRP